MEDFMPIEELANRLVQMCDNLEQDKEKYVKYTHGLFTTRFNNQF